MTYAETKKRINELCEERENAYEITTVWEEVYKCVGFGDFEGTGEYREKEIRIYDTVKQKKIQKEIDELKESIREEEERRNNERKYKRYLKEIEKLEEEINYKKEWIKKYLER